MEVLQTVVFLTLVKITSTYIIIELKQEIQISPDILDYVDIGSITNEMEANPADCSSCSRRCSHSYCTKMGVGLSCTSSQTGCTCGPSNTQKPVVSFNISDIEKCEVSVSPTEEAVIEGCFQCSTSDDLQCFPDILEGNCVCFDQIHPRFPATRKNPKTCKDYEESHAPHNETMMAISSPIDEYHGKLPGTCAEAPLTPLEKLTQQCLRCSHVCREYDATLNNCICAGSIIIRKHPETCENVPLSESEATRNLCAACSCEYSENDDMCRCNSPSYHDILLPINTCVERTKMCKSCNASCLYDFADNMCTCDNDGFYHTRHAHNCKMSNEDMLNEQCWKCDKQCFKFDEEYKSCQCSTHEGNLSQIYRLYPGICAEASLQNDEKSYNMCLDCTTHNLHCSYNECTRKCDCFNNEHKKNEEIYPEKCVRNSTSYK